MGDIQDKMELAISEITIYYNYKHCMSLNMSGNQMVTWTADKNTFDHIHIYKCRLELKWINTDIHTYSITISSCVSIT